LENNMYLGIDLISITRFEDWQKKSIQSLSRIFHESEIVYCLKNIDKSAERFAVCFASKEALFKAITQYDPFHKIPFLTVASVCYVQRHESGLPIMFVDWQQLRPYFSTQDLLVKTVSMSVSHEKEYAVVVVWF